MQLKSILKKIYTKDYLILICIGFLPLLWKILEIVFVSNYENALKILGQISLISIIFKIFEESLLNPLYKTLSKQNYENENNKNLIAKKFLIYYTLSTIIFSLALFLLTKEILTISQVPEHIFEETLKFIKLYIIASGFGVISKYLYTFSLLNKDTKKMIVYFLLKSAATAMLFLCLVPKFTVGLGVYGIAISELIINICALLFFIFSLPKTKKTKIRMNSREYIKLFIIALLETLIRNVVYYFVILVFLNTLDNQDLYFISNEFIWCVMLVPTLAQSSLIKQELANNKNTSLKPYFINGIFLNLFIVVLIPVALLVFKYVYALNNYLDFFIVLLKLLPCYILFIFDSIVESYFISSGKMHHILIQSIITNILVYLTALILFLCNIWTITLNSIILLFNLGVIISSIYTIAVFCITKNKNNEKIKLKTNHS